MKFIFGKNIKANTFYNKEAGYGFLPPVNIFIKDGPDFVYASNYRSQDTIPHYEYPTFIIDLPNGIYNVTITQTTNGTKDAVNGAYINGNMYAIRWSNEDFATNSYDEPTADSYIYTKACTEQTVTKAIAVFNKQLKIEFATSLTNEGVSGITYVKEISIEKVTTTTSLQATTLHFIGDSTLAKYPPMDGKEWMPIPERSGWAEDFSFKRYTDGNVLLVNHAVAGSSVKSYIYEGFLNNFLLSCKPGDTCLIEAGINDNAVGRRFSTPQEFNTTLQTIINACIDYGQRVILVSGTSAFPEFNAEINKLAIKNSLPYIDLLGLWKAFLNKTDKTYNDLTVDGTHLRRVGSIIAARFVANAIKDFTDYSMASHIPDININYAPPTCVVTNPKILSQTKKCVTLGWEIAEDTLYENNQLITDFNIYEVSPEGRSLIYVAPAYVSAGMTHPKLKATLPINGGTNAFLSITCNGVTGEGPFSDLIRITPYEPTVYESLLELINKLESPVYDPSTYTKASYDALTLILNEAKTYTIKDDVSDIYHKLLIAEDKLIPVATCIERTDFSLDTPGQIPWELEGESNFLSTTVLEENGNQLLKAYVEAAGPRFITKHFKEALNLNASKIIIDFTWYAGKPDLRNVCELEFYSSNTNRLVSLKASSNGHIGYVVGNYPEDDISYMKGDGFHTYKNSKAHDLGLPTNEWYKVRLEFDFIKQCLLLEINDVKIDNIRIDSAGTNTVSMLNLLLARGKKDNGHTNDLSILWETKIDNFAMFYI